MEEAWLREVLQVVASSEVPDAKSGRGAEAQDTDDYCRSCLLRVAKDDNTGHGPRKELTKRAAGGYEQGNHGCRDAGRHGDGKAAPTDSNEGLYGDYQQCGRDHGQRHFT